MNPNPEREPTGLEFASITDIAEEMSRRFDSFVLAYSSDHKLDSALFKPTVLYKNTLESMGLCRLATVFIERITLDGLLGDDDDLAAEEIDDA